MRSALTMVAVAVCVLAAADGVAGAEAVTASRMGRVTALQYDGEYVNVDGLLRVPLRGWRAVPGLWNAQDVRFSREDGRQVWTGRVEVGQGRFCAVRQELTDSGNAATLSLKVTAEADLDTEGAYYFLGLPIAAFAGGRGELWAGQEQVGAAQMPVDRPENRHFLSGTATAVRVTDAGGNLALTVSLGRPVAVSVQDTREWGSEWYQLYFELAGGPMGAGRSAELDIGLRLEGRADRSPARLTVDPSRSLHRMDGFGGNYCFNVNSPVTQYTLQHLDSAWARVEMKLFRWEPENDNASPEVTNWQALRANDSPDSELRQDLLLAQQLQRRGIPYVASVWAVPGWLTTEPARSPWEGGREVPRQRWPELFECIGSYLIHARDAYGVEPDLFSFNEPRYGVRVRLSAEEHRDIIKLLGAHLERLGLKTKMLLGDVASARGTHTYANPTVEDAEALGYVGAVAFHSWGGATPEQYGAWTELAGRLGLPLLVTELGVDANWRDVPLHTLQYALQELRMYQELVYLARPQGTMQWEFTGDYSLLDQERTPSGEQRLVPTVRFWFVKHFCNLTPKPATVLHAESDNDRTLITAFRGERQAGGQPAYTFHVANIGAGRRATLAGLPPEVRQLQAIRSGESDSFRELAPVAVTDGAVTLQLAPNSLLTLTTLP